MLRAVVGLVFIMHGWQKVFVYGFDGVAQTFAGMGIPLAGVNGVVVPLLELVGGVLLVLGLFTRLVSLPLAATMVVAVLVAHLGNGFFAQDGGYEFALTLLAGTIALALAGPGELALDNAVARRRDGVAAGARRTAIA